MKHYAGLDVSIKETSVCVIDGAGQVVREVKVPTEPEAILAVLADEAFAIERIGLEAGPLSQWLYSTLADAGLPVICVETRHMKAAPSDAGRRHQSPADLVVAHGSEQKAMKYAELLAQDPSGDQQWFGDGGQVRMVRDKLAYPSFYRGLNSAPAEFRSFRPCSGKPSVDAFANDAAFELSEDAEHLEHGFASGGRGVEPLLVKEQINAFIVKALQDSEQVRQRSAQPINRPGRDHIELAGVDGLQHGVEPRAHVPALGAADAGVLVDLCDLPTGSSSDRLQFTTLVVGVLF
jgi:hypothetical protein